MTRKGPRLHGIAGIDEAGRGPMIGPMVICGVLIEPERMSELTAIGVKDSKLLTPARRIELKDKIEEIVSKTIIRTISAEDIDRLRRHTTLNEIEVVEFASIAKTLGPSELYLDAADVVSERFGVKIGMLSGLTSQGAIIISEHKADVNYPLVSSASILAKVERDRIISSFHETYGFFGSGYSTDPHTIEYVKELVRTKQELPPIIRRTWESVRKIVDNESTNQLTLD